MALLQPRHLLAISHAVSLRHERQSGAPTSPRHCARPYAWSGAVLMVFVANPVDTVAAAARIDVVRTYCVEWLVGVGYCCKDVEIGLGRLYAAACLLG